MLDGLDTEVLLLWECFNLSVDGNGFGGLKADYLVVKDYCALHGLESIFVYGVIREMISKYKK